MLKEHPALVVADFRREYSISWHELNRLNVAEFTALIYGLSGGSRLVDELSKETATVSPMNEAQTAEQFAAHISRHPNAVVEVVKRGR